MTILSTILTLKGKKAQKVKVLAEGNKYTVIQCFGNVTITTKEMNSKEALNEYHRIINSYYWELL